jgi:hypothetical protein
MLRVRAEGISTESQSVVPKETFLGWGGDDSVSLVSVPLHSWIDLFCVTINAAGEIPQSRKANASKKTNRMCAPNAVMAIHHDILVAPIVQFLHPLHQLTQRYEPRSRESHKFVLLWIPNIEQFRRGIAFQSGNQFGGRDGHGE